MNSQIVFSGQSFLDKVLESTGSIENAIEMALLNNVSITDDVVVGSDLKITGKINKVVVASFINKKPATALNFELQNSLNPDGGIGAMILEDTFIVQ